MTDNLYQTPEAEELIKPQEQSIPEDLNPWKTIWSRPRETYRYLIARRPDYMVVLLAVVSGIYNAINQKSMKSAGDTESLGFILGSSLVGGLFTGLIFLFLFSWLIKHTGRWLGGKAESLELRVVYAWSSVPSLLGISMLTIQLIIFGKDIFTSTMASLDASIFNQVIFWGTTFLETGLGVWSFIWFIVGVSEVHGVSKWRAFFSMLLAFLLLILPFVLLGVLVAIAAN